MKHILLAAALGAAALTGGAAQAVTVTFYSGNECGAGGFDSCTSNGAAVIAKYKGDGTLDETNGTVFPSIDGSEFKLTFASTSQGTWTYMPGEGDPTITAVAAKAGNGYLLFTDLGNLLSGNWYTNQFKDLSHLTFFGVPGTDTAPVPLPAAGALLLGGLGGLAALRRRRKSA